MTCARSTVSDVPATTFAGGVAELPGCQVTVRGTAVAFGLYVTFWIGNPTSSSGSSSTTRASRQSSSEQRTWIW
ncbi:hypothetical protein SAMN05421671_1111 [Pimelobacter simplex]|nr:hypothetical protein SAMN05421671_1111 [Pimelobacter simplex]